MQKNKHHKLTNTFSSSSCGTSIKKERNSLDLVRESDTKNGPVLYRGWRSNEPLTARYNWSIVVVFWRIFPFFSPLFKEEKKKKKVEDEGEEGNTNPLKVDSLSLSLERRRGRGGGLAKNGGVEWSLSFTCILYTHTKSRCTIQRTLTHKKIF